MQIPLKKILLVGHTGFLGSHLAHLLNDEFEVVTLDKSILDLSKKLSHSLEVNIKTNKYDYAVICAAISDVEKCFQDQALSKQVNVDGMQELLILLKRHSVMPIFFSSDYVFSEKLTPYVETDSPCPTTIYGNQKLAIELIMKNTFNHFLIFRTSKLMSKTNHPKNILYPITRNLKEGKTSNCFEDQFLNPIFVEDIAKVIKRAIKEKISGIFHLGTKKYFSRYELGIFLANSLGCDPYLIKPTSMRDIAFSENRPTNNMLDATLISKIFNFNFCEVEESISVIKTLN